MRKKAGVIFILSLLPFLSFTQIQQQLFLQDFTPFYSDSGRMALTLNANTFFNNNEFFETVVEGYTLTGAWFQPGLEYTVNRSFLISVGVHLLKYNGKDGFNQTIPLFSLSYRPSPRSELLMGSFNGGESLELPEPLHKFERQFTHLVNQGVLYQYTGNRFHGKAWLNWHAFIEPGDSSQEKFTAGYSGHICFYRNEHFEWGLPLHILTHHAGGQINTGGFPVETLLESGFGTTASWLSPNPFIHTLSFTPMLLFKASSRHTGNSLAYYPSVNIRSERFESSLAYFYGKELTSLYGEPLYFSPSLTREERSLLCFKSGIHSMVSGKSFMSLRVELYYDLNRKNLAYTFGLLMSLDEKLHFKKDLSP